MKLLLGDSDTLLVLIRRYLAVCRPVVLEFELAFVVLTLLLLGTLLALVFGDALEPNSPSIPSTPENGNALFVTPLTSAILGGTQLRVVWPREWIIHRIGVTWRRGRRLSLRRRLGESTWRVICILGLGEGGALAK